jgi:hypothetical protein
MTCPHMRSSWKSCPHCLGINQRRQRALEHEGRVTNLLIVVALVLVIMLFLATRHEGGCLDTNSCTPRTTTSLTTFR